MSDPLDTPPPSPPNHPRGESLVFVASERKAPAADTGRVQGKPAIAFLLTILFFVALCIAASLWFLRQMYATLPTFEQLHDIEPPQVSRVYAADNSLIHEFSIERRIWVPIGRVPQMLCDAVISIEDRRFYSHWGISIQRIFGAAMVNIVRRGYAQGASTITQQLARNLYLTAKQSMVRKIREALTAVQLESYYTKREILESYLNQVYLGAGAYGVQAASLTYFSKEIDSLDINECATLAGCIQLPERYRPDRIDNHPRTIARRNAVLRAMVAVKALSKSVADSVAALPAPYNPSTNTTVVAPYFIDMVRGQIASRYGDDMLYNGGLRIYTTLDPVAQDTIERAAARHLDSLQRRCNRMFVDSVRHILPKMGIKRELFMARFDSVYKANHAAFDTLADSLKLRTAQVAVVALDVRTGGIRALMGGKNFSASKFNRALNARRQPGSSIKPIVYTAAVDEGFSPATIVLDQPITLMTDKGEWRPENYDRSFYGPVALRLALAKSINLVAIQVLMQIGPEKVVDFARRMGLKNDMPAVPALAIGVGQATPLEMTAAYAIYANAGLATEPFCIVKVIDRNGRTLEERAVQSRQAIRPQTAFIMADMLKDVIRRGTGARIPGMGFTRPAGGKTGTTNDYSDAWFIGFTPQIACGVWVGVDERRSLGHGVTGSDGAVPIWVPAMLALHRKLPYAEFSVPDSISRARACTETGLLAREHCPRVIEEYFITGMLPDSCSVHSASSSPRSNYNTLFGPSTHRKPEPKDSAKPKRPLMF